MLAMACAGGSAAAPLGVPDFTALVEQTRPAVVNTSTTHTHKARSSGRRLPKGLPTPDPPVCTRLSVRGAAVDSTAVVLRIDRCPCR